MNIFIVFYSASVGHNLPLNSQMSGFQITLKEGLEMLRIFKSYPAKTSLLDDFDFYENREKLSRSQRTEHTGSKKEEYNNDSHHVSCISFV
jgi:YTH domain-containing family protein